MPKGLNHCITLLIPLPATRSLFLWISWLAFFLKGEKYTGSCYWTWFIFLILSLILYLSSDNNFSWWLGSFNFKCICKLRQEITQHLQQKNNFSPKIQTKTWCVGFRKKKIYPSPTENHRNMKREGVWCAPPFPY